jgi:hypothetical protein
LLFGLSFTGNEIDEQKAIEEILSLVIRESLSESFRSSPQVKAENLRDALLQKLETVSKAIMSGSPRGDVEKLIRDFRSKMDGCFGGNPRDDWVINCYWQEKLIREIDALVEAIKGFYNL